MKNVLIIVSTNRNSNQSNSYKVAKIIKQKFETYYNDYSIEIANLMDYNIQMCKGCMNCFDNGFCIIKDDIETIKEKMLMVSHIMLISPVYAHNVSSVMKNFIDRCSSWIHILKLLGKTSSSVVVTSSNGQMFVSEYLKKILELLGTIYIRGFEVTVDIPPMLKNEKDMDLVLTKFLKALHEEIEGPVNLKKIERQCAAFNLYKKTCSNSNIKCFEVEQWQTDEDLKKYSFLEAYRFRKMKLE